MKILRPAWGILFLAGTASFFLWTAEGNAQESRAGLIEKQQEQKSKGLLPELPDKIEQFITRMEHGGWFFSPIPRGFYPYFESVYPGGGFTGGAGYRKYVGDYTFAEVRGLYSIKNYKKIEFHTGTSNLAGGHLDAEASAGWTDATQIPYYGIGLTDREGESNFRIQEIYARGGLTLKPARWFQLRGSSGYDYYKQRNGTGLSPSIEELYTPDTAPTLGVNPTYIHTEVSAAIVTAPALGYARRGGVYRYTVHDFENVKGNLESFQVTRTEAIQHIPILRETWVLSLRGRLESAHGPMDGIPYYLLPWLGSGSTLRGYGTGRFRDKHSLLMSGEWRWIPNRFFLDMALFMDAGTVAPRFKDLEFSKLKYDYGIGIRIHGPEVTPLRFDVAHSDEGWQFVISASAPF